MRVLLALVLTACSSFPRAYPVWTARVTGDVGAAFTGSYTVLQRGGAMASMSVSGFVPRTPDGTSGWAEWSVSDGSRIIGATFINSGVSPALRAEIRRNNTVIANGSATGRYASILLSPP
jgi:hypothetical protein